MWTRRQKKPTAPPSIRQWPTPLCPPAHCPRGSPSPGGLPTVLVGPVPGLFWIGVNYGLFFFLLGFMGRRESRAGHDSQAVFCRRGVRKWSPGAHPEQRGGKARATAVPSTSVLARLHVQRKVTERFSGCQSAWLWDEWLVALPLPCRVGIV